MATLLCSPIGCSRENAGSLRSKIDGLNIEIARERNEYYRVGGNGLESSSALAKHISDLEQEKAGLQQKLSHLQPK